MKGIATRQKLRLWNYAHQLTIQTKLWSAFPKPLLKWKKKCVKKEMMQMNELDEMKIILNERMMHMIEQNEMTLMQTILIYLIYAAVYEL